MKVATWKTFIDNHPDIEELDKASKHLHQFITLTDTTDNNLERICASECLVIVTNDTFRDRPLPIFFHHRLGLPIEGAKKRLVGLTGFGDYASPVEIEGDKLCAATDNAINTPSLDDFFTAAEKGIDEVSKLEPRDNESHKIRLGAILPPRLALRVMNMGDTSAASLLFQAIWIIRQDKPKEVITVDDETKEDGDEPQESNAGNDDDTAAANAEEETTTADKESEWKFAEEYMPLLVTLWSFLRSTEATKAIVPPMKSATSDRKTLDWCRKAHEKYIQHHSVEEKKENLTSEANVIESIHRLAKSLEDRNNDKFAALTEVEDKATKGWTKLEETFKKVILFASSPDGENAADGPTPRLKTLLNTKNGALVARLFANWHSMDIIVQTGMASNINKGSLLSDHSPFSITNFSPFFTPPGRAGFTPLTNMELNCLDFAATNNSMTDSDIQKMVHSQPYVPTQPHLLIAQIRNWHAVVCDIFGEDALISVNIEDVITHYTQNEMIYYNLFVEEEFFAVWFINQLHFKCQRLLHSCAAAAAVSDVPFQQLNFSEELSRVDMNSVHARAPSWYRKLLQEKDTRSSTTSTKAKGRNQESQPTQDHQKRRTISNLDLDPHTKLKPSERYSSLIHRNNVQRCLDAEVIMDGRSVCNNWHLRGWCTDSCTRKGSHTKLNPPNLAKYKKYVGLLRKHAEAFRRGQSSSIRSNPGERDSTINPTCTGEETNNGL